MNLTLWDLRGEKKAFNPVRLFIYLLLLMGLGIMFLGFKATEYALEAREHLIPNFNFGAVIVPLSCLCLATSLIQAWSLLRLRKGWQSFLRRAFLVCLSLGLYGLELRNAVGLITDPTQVGFVYGLLFTLLGILGLGLTRAWELLGAHRYGIGGWLNPLQDVHDGESFSRADDADSASGPPPTDEVAPRSPSQ